MCWTWPLVLGVSNNARNVFIVNVSGPQEPLTSVRMYNEAMGRNLADKYSNLNSQLDKIVNDANSEIESLQTKIKGTREC